MNLFAELRKDIPNCPDRLLNQISVVSGDRLNVIWFILSNHHLATAYDVWECGVYKGGSALFICRTLAELGYRGCFRGFDTFRGIPSVSDKNGTLKAGMFDGVKLAEVRRLFLNFTFPVEFSEGEIPVTFYERRADRISFAHLDMDSFQSTMDGLEFIFPRLGSGGVIVVDDYGADSCPGCKSAVDEFCGRNHAVFEVTKGGQAIMVKYG